VQSCPQFKQAVSKGSIRIVKTLAPAEIPATWNDVTPEWMTDAVAHHHPGAHVSEVTVVAATKGNNRRARFRLRYDAGSGPEFLFAKAEGDFRQMHAQNGNLFNEPELFLSGETIPVAHPRPYKVIMDRAALDYIVVMEDVTGRGGNPLTAESTLTVDQAANGVRGLARLHSRYWDVSAQSHPALAWLRGWEPTEGFLQALRKSVPAGLDKAVGHMPAALDRYDGAALVGYLARCMTSFTRGPQTLLHGDAHIGNTFVLPGNEMGFLDWQVARRGNWSQDLGYFFVSALTVEDRRAHEGELLREYLDALELPAQRRPSRDEAWERYRASMAFALPIWFATLNASVTQTPEGSLSLCKRYGHAFVDLDTVEVLAQLGV
jgi:Phosphotransferase enzyme family